LAAYGILGGYEDGFDEDDNEGSRAVPSRTSIGCEAAFIEKFPSYGGMKWGIRNFAYQCKLTLPEIELMMADLPHTLYSRRDGKPRQSDIDEATRLMREAYEKKRRGEEYTVEEIFAGKAEMDEQGNKE